jgi:hypothetical protein
MGNFRKRIIALGTDNLEHDAHLRTADKGIGNSVGAPGLMTH